jgi:hypothetical protein
MDRPFAYSIENTRKQLGDCSRAHVYRLVNRGLLELTHAGSRSLITTRSIEKLLEAGLQEAA